MEWLVVMVTDCEGGGGGGGVVVVVEDPLGDVSQTGQTDPQTSPGCVRVKREGFTWNLERRHEAEEGGEEERE